MAVFLGVLGTMALWEVAAPRRRRDIPRLLRWSNNLALVVLDTLAVRLLFPVLAVGLALVTAERGWVLCALDRAGMVRLCASVLLLDLAIYLQHVAFHAVPALWRLHRMHHADLETDVTTGLRFHPVDILLSMAIKLAVVAGLGPPALAVLTFEVLLNATAMFNHGNVRLPEELERALRLALVTPTCTGCTIRRREETDSNFGFNLAWWDRLFGTYRAQPADGHEAMTIGLAQFRTRRDLWLDRMLLQPLRGIDAEPLAYPAGKP